MRVLHFVVLGSLVAAFYMYRLGDLPIYVWDEARVGVNALEMMQAGHPLVTTYDGLPDLWNTKPPLAIWLEAASMRAFGVSEFALRLGSAAAATATTLMVFAFTSRVSGSRPTGLMASLVLMGCFGYTGVHVARTADYDALLTLFTTATAMSLWFALEGSERPASQWLVLCGAMIAAAVLTKGVAGIMILPGLAIYATDGGHARRLLRSPAALAGAALAIGLPLAYYLLRDAEGPGYLRAVAENELGARFMHPIFGGQPRPWSYYLHFLIAPPALPLSPSAFPWALLLPASGYLAVTSKQPRVRSASLMCCITLTTFLVVITVAATRFAWYAAPIYPFIALLSAFAAQRLWATSRFGLDRFPLYTRASAALGGAAIVAAFVVAHNNHIIGLAPRYEEMRAAEMVRETLESHRAPDPIRIINDGFGELNGRPDDNGRPYVGPVEFYAEAARRHGRDVRVEQSSYRPKRGETLIWCPADLKRAFNVRGAVLLDNGACRAVASERGLDLVSR